MSEINIGPSDLPLNLAPPEGISLPLWRSLARGFGDLISPEKLPPLVVTSRPVDLGMLLGDYLRLPWYRTVFTNLGEVVLPDTQPPLELESRPVDVGELLGDELRRPWWKSMVRNLADLVAPEKLPALELSSKPVNPFSPSSQLILTNWSNVIDGPKVFLPDTPRAASASTPGLVLAPAPRTEPIPVEFVNDLERDLRRDLHWSKMRQRFLIAVFAAEIVFLVAGRYILDSRLFHR
jgi:hypothetical protein